MSSAPRIYNLFPRLAGRLTSWRQKYLERASRMGFNWVFLNPVHYCGFSGSLYAVKDYYRYDPALIDPDSPLSPEEQLRSALTAGRSLGLRFMVDLVINHTASDSALASEHPDWYRHEPDGSLSHPGCLDNGCWVSWGDLATVDNAASLDRAALWDYWDALVAHYQRLGFAGFRCDAAYQVPSDLWRHLMGRARGRGEAVFFAETLGCTVEQTVATARAGFDYLFNSFQWWDLCRPWFPAQYRRTCRVASSVAFPESHDTPRLFPEGGERLLRQRYVLAAAISSGVMMPVGYEFGFSRRLNVVETSERDWEEPAVDLTGFIAAVNAAKARFPILNADSPPWRVRQDNPRVTCLLRRWNDARLLICANRGLEAAEDVALDLAGVLGEGRGLRDVLEPERKVPRRWKARLEPGEVRLIHSGPVV